MSRLQRVVVIASIALLAPPAAAGAAAPPRGPEATVRAYVEALRAEKVDRACALLDPSYWADALVGCRGSLRAELPGSRLARVRIEPGALTRGARARVVVDLVVKEQRRDPWAARARVMLRHIGGRWQIRQSGPLPGIDRRLRERTPRDVAPSGSEDAALRRLADDELLAVSGNEWMLCELLAPGAPLGERDGGCETAGLRGSVDDLRYDVRADRVAIHRIGADRARLEVALTIREAVRTKAKPGWRVRAHRRTDTLYAVRASGRWRLAKISRRAYLLLGVTPPDDAAAPTATATWPFTDVPSLSERPVPADCRRPFEAWGSDCPLVAAFAAGGGLVAWSWLESVGQAFARPVAVGQPTGPTTTVTSSRVTKENRHYWLPEAVAPVADGALVLERDLIGEDAVRAVPMGLDGRPRGVAQLVGTEQPPADDGTLRVIPGPLGATTATVLLASGQVLRLGADGRQAGPGGMVTDLYVMNRLLARPDGTFLELGGGGQEDALEIGTRTADGRPSGTIATQAAIRAGDRLPEVAGAQDAEGHVLVAWMEVDDRGRGIVRAWAFDPAAPAATAPVTVTTNLRASDADTSFQSGEDVVTAVALPGGGWGIAWQWLPKAGGSELWAARLDATGAPATAPRRVTDRLGGTALGRAGFGLAGDTVAFIEWPELAGLPQVRAAPLP